MVTGTPCAGNLVDSRLKELLPALPVVYVKAVPVQVYLSRFVFMGNIILFLKVNKPRCLPKILCSSSATLLRNSIVEYF